MAALLPEGLPTVAALRDEGLRIETHAVDARAETPDRVVAILNLMPDKIATETQLIRMLGGGSAGVEVVLFATNGYMSRVRDPDYRSANTPVQHLRTFYRSFDEVRDLALDGLIITGAPVEHMPYEDVPYWTELLEVFDWAEARSLPTYSICWAAQAALKHFHDVPKYVLDRKVFGVFDHQIEADSPLLTGFGAGFRVPVSRYSEVLREDLPATPSLKVLADSDGAGLCLLEDSTRRHHYMFNHFEYDADTLKHEYDRDSAAGDSIHIPVGYYPADDPGRMPEMDWRENGRRLFGNWLKLIGQSESAGR